MSGSFFSSEVVINFSFVFVPFVDVNVMNDETKEEEKRKRVENIFEDFFIKKKLFIGSIDVGVWYKQ